MHAPQSPTPADGLRATLETRADGCQVLRATEPLRWYPDRLTDALEQWAAEAPERTFAAKRDQGGDWRRISYAQMLQRVRAVGQALTDRGLSAERPVAILSDNDLEHLTLALGAMWAGVPHVPVSPAYSLISQDHGKLRHVFATVTPGLVFASSAAYGKAISAVAGPDVEVVLTQGTLDDRAVTPFDALLATPPAASGDAAHAQVGPDTIAKFLFTSGSTKLPKAVHQHPAHAVRQPADDSPEHDLPGRRAAGAGRLAAVEPHLRRQPQRRHCALQRRHALHRRGQAHAQGHRRDAAQPARGLAHRPTSMYPRAWKRSPSAAEHDALLRRSLFARLKAFFFAGAGLSQAVWDRLDRLGEQTRGQRVPMITGLGMTETAPSATFALGANVRSGHIGLPVPGCEVKLVPTGDIHNRSPWDKVEIRFRGPHVMPGYWRAPEQTAEALDAEGYYCTGDAARFIDPEQPTLGLRFDGRIAEDFKLSTGTFVSVGPLRARVIGAGDPCVQDAVVTGLNRDEIGLLLFPRLDECRRLAGLDATVPAPEVLHHPAVRAFFQTLADTLWRQGTGSANRPTRLHVLAEPPSIDLGEVTDKGSINQRAVLQHRAALVEALYEGRVSDPFLILPNKI